MNHRSMTTSRQQRGAALMVAMVLLFMMSILGVTAMRESSLEKRMTTNSVHKSKTFQRAESGTDIAIGDPDNLSAAFASNGADLTISLPVSSDTGLASDAKLRWVGSGPPVGFSLGSGGGFQALRYMAQGAAEINAVQSSSEVRQGAYRTVPALTQ